MPNPFLHSERSSAMLAGILIGAIAWAGHLFTLPLVLAIPMLVPYCKQSSSRFLLIAGYNAGATWPTLPGAQLFFGHHFRPLDTLLLWVCLVFLLTVPWIFVNGRHRIVWWGLPLSLLIGAALPIGLANPLTATGALFPHTSWGGLLLILLVFAVLPVYPKYTIAGTALVALICNIAYHKPPSPPTAWQAISTNFSGAGFGQMSFLQQYQAATAIQAEALESSARVVVFPESSVYRWNDSTDLFWTTTIQSLQQQGKTVLLGAGRSLSASRQFHNVIIVRGSSTTEYLQHFPMPYGMWRPFGLDGVPLRFGGPYTIDVAGQKAAPLICYEQLLIYPVLRSMLDRPTLVIAISNDYWAKGTPIPAIQLSTVKAWSRLFSVPYLSANNE